MDGKPRIVSQQYLGSGEEVAAKLAGQSMGAPVRSQHKEFGALAAVWSVLERLGVASAVDQVAPRRADAAATTGTYIALAAANRVVAPCSKAAFARWRESTAGPRFTKVPASAVDHRRFWEAMDLLEEDLLAGIEAELGRRIVTEFGPDLSGLILGMTNFATFIDSGNDKAELAQRGKAKQKRVDLRLIGLALVVTRDGGVPVLSRAYPGDRRDVTQFTGVIDDLLDRYRALTQQVESLTVVYDAGQNSTANYRPSPTVRRRPRRPAVGTPQVDDDLKMVLVHSLRTGGRPSDPVGPFGRSVRARTNSTDILSAGADCFLARRGPHDVRQAVRADPRDIRPGRCCLSGCPGARTCPPSRFQEASAA
ncbi:IS1634 family transposase [Actinacidiphila soli]|uniref:IS1634 family transposase n=1 Tax=Actinacidiphila soli TaxID=2487275 RepID=UPI0019D10CF6|nr:hypothetical protein [Actinacidiphila soli]